LAGTLIQQFVRSFSVEPLLSPPRPERFVELAWLHAARAHEHQVLEEVREPRFAISRPSRRVPHVTVTIGTL
jgi:hypothetical protein